MTNQQLIDVMRIAKHHLDHEYLHLGMLTLGELLKKDLSFTDEQLDELKQKIVRNLSNAEVTQHD